MGHLDDNGSGLDRENDRNTESGQGSKRDDASSSKSESRDGASQQAGAGEGAFSWGKGLLPDIIKKMFVAGIGAVAVGEEGIRRLATDMSLPKDVVVFLISQVQSTKNELFRIVAREIRDFLEHTDLGGELQKALTSLTFEVTMQIRLKPSKDSNGVIPSVAGNVKVRSSQDDE